MAEWGRNGDFLRAKHAGNAQLTPEQQAAEARDKSADAIVKKALESMSVDPATPKEAEEGAAAWDRAMNADRNTVRDYILSDLFERRSPADQNAYILRWCEIRGL